MKSILSAKQRIFGIISVIILLVGAIGVYTYGQFSDVVTKISETSTEDPGISRARKILSNIAQAENQIKRYSLTEDSVFLEKFVALRDVVDTQLVDLKMLKPMVAGSIHIDSFQSLVLDRFEILNELVAIQDEFRVEEAFKNIHESISQAKIAQPEAPKKPKSWFKRNSKKETPAEGKVDLTQVNKNIREVQKVATSKAKNQRERELELLEADGENGLALLSIVETLETAKKNNAKKRVDKVAALVRRTNIQVIVFCVVICLLLILTSVTILNYIRRNSAFRKMLNRAKNEAESLASAKALFVATVSHEIRTPINIIAGFSEQLDESPLNDQQRDQLLGIKQSSAHLLDLVNAVLDFTKLENNHLTLEKRNFSPSTLVSTVESLVSKMAAENEVQLNSTIDEKVPAVLLGDEFRLRQILLNLVGNAIKFSRGGKVVISVGALFSEEKILLSIKIQDNGIGMTAEELSTVFDEFVQANNKTTRLYGGTGLGLPITKKLIELHGGTMKLESESGIGTTVHLEIPVDLSDGEQLDSEIVGREKIDLSKTKVLVVDDEPFNRKLIRSILSKHSASIIEAVNGREAIEAVETQSFDLILMDIQMPLVDGFEASMEIQKLNKNIPIVALSAAVTLKDIEAYKNAGMHSFLPKPFKQSELLHKFSEVLSIPVVFVADPKESIPEVKSTENLEKLGFDDLKRMSEGDVGFYLDMLETFETSTREGIQNLNHALATSNWKDAGEFAHRISPACKHLSAHSLYHLLKRIEENCRDNSNLEQVPSLIKEASIEADRVIAIIHAERLTANK